MQGMLAVWSAADRVSKSRNYFSGILIYCLESVRCGAIKSIIVKAVLKGRKMTHANSLGDLQFREL